MSGRAYKGMQNQYLVLVKFAEMFLFGAVQKCANVVDLKENILKSTHMYLLLLTRIACKIRPRYSRERASKNTSFRFLMPQIVQSKKNEWKIYT